MAHQHQKLNARAARAARECSSTLPFFLVTFATCAVDAREAWESAGDCGPGDSNGLAQESSQIERTPFSLQKGSGHHVYLSLFAAISGEPLLRFPPRVAVLPTVHTVHTVDVVCFLLPSENHGPGVRLLVKPGISSRTSGT